MKITDRKNVRIEIWERGAGYTYGLRFLLFGFGRRGP